MLNATLYGLREGARDWYDRLHRHGISLGFTTAPGDPTAYALAIHVDDALTCGNEEFFNTVLVPLLGQFSISKLEQSSFKFFGMHIKQTDDFSVHIWQDTKSIKNLPQGADFLKEEEKQGIFIVSGRSTMYCI